MAPAASPSVIVSGRSLASVGRNTDRTMRPRGEYEISTMAGLVGDLARAIALDDADTVVDLSAVRLTVGFAGALSRQVTMARPGSLRQWLRPLDGWIIHASSPERSRPFHPD
jgi:hypothetical protein